MGSFFRLMCDFDSTVLPFNSIISVFLSSAAAAVNPQTCNRRCFNMRGIKRVNGGSTSVAASVRCQSSPCQAAFRASSAAERQINLMQLRRNSFLSFTATTKTSPCCHGYSELAVAAVTFIVSLSLPVVYANR